MAAAGSSIAQTTGLVLAGGLGRRMGGLDKGLVDIAGRPLVERVLAALRPQVSQVMISANRNQARYAAYGHAVVADALGGYLGPLDGILGALHRLDTAYLLTVPCDAPLVAPDLAECLHRARAARCAELAVAHDGRRRQPAFLLLGRSLAGDLQDYLEGGGRRVDRWLERHAVADADLSHRADCFVNVNDPAEMDRVEALLLSMEPPA